MNLKFENNKDREEFISKISIISVCPHNIGIIDERPQECGDCESCWRTALQQGKEASLQSAAQRKAVLIHYIIELCEKLPDDDNLTTASRILANLTNNQDIWENGMATDIFNTWLSAESDKERSSIEGMFLIFAGIEFDSFLDNCLREITRTE